MAFALRAVPAYSVVHLLVEAAAHVDAADCRVGALYMTLDAPALHIMMLPLLQVVVFVRV